MDSQLYNIVPQLLTLVAQFFIVFFPVLTGVYLKESYEVIQRKKRKVKLKLVIISTCALTILMIGFVEYLINKLGLSFSITALFIFGAGGKNVVEMLFDGRLLKILLKFLGKTKGSLQESIDEALNEDINK
jgi:hypothetical protein